MLIAPRTAFFCFTAEGAELCSFTCLHAVTNSSTIATLMAGGHPSAIENGVSGSTEKEWIVELNYVRSHLSWGAQEWIVELNYV